MSVINVHVMELQTYSISQHIKSVARKLPSINYLRFKVKEYLIILSSVPINY